MLTGFTGCYGVLVGFALLDKGFTGFQEFRFGV